jgi:hypothetical protein
MAVVARERFYVYREPASLFLHRHGANSRLDVAESIGGNLFIQMRSSKLPRDFNQRAKAIVDLATAEPAADNAPPAQVGVTVRWHA